MGSHRSDGIRRFGIRHASIGKKYDSISRLSFLSHDLDGSLTTYDLAYSFAYSPADQMVQQNLSNSVYAFAAPAVGQSTYTTNGLNQYTQIAAPAAAILTYDPNGNLTSDGSSTYRYDAENHLTTSTGVHTATLNYDPNGRLFETISGSTTTQFLFDGDNLVAEYNGAGVLQRRYVNGPSVDEPLVWYEGSTVGSSSWRYIHADHRGSVVAIANGSGSTIATNTYDSYGIPGASNTGRFQYTGQAVIPELQFYYFRARFYSPQMGRFLQTDPIGYKDDVDLYTYVGNDPLNLKDHNGKWPTPVHEEIINKAFPGLSRGQRGILKSSSAWMDHKPNGQTQANAFQHSMKAPGEDPAKAKQDAQAFMGQKREEAQIAQGQGAENTSQISDRALSAAGEAIHTATDSTSPAHVDANGNPRDWGGVPVVGAGSVHDAEVHNAEEANPTPAQFDSAVRAAQDQFIKVFGSGPVCVQATGSEAACR